MDFLDPRKKRNHKIRLLTGYFLISIVIGLATVILVYGAYGYGINTKTGQIIENGLLFVDSKPGGANIYLNGQHKSSTTAARMVLAAGDYSLSIQKDGYRSWQRNFVLDEHTIARYVYPFLFPIKPFTLALKSYPAMPSIVTETPDRHWLLVESPQSTQGNLLFDQYDTSDLSKASELLSLPKNILTPADNSTFKEVEWSTNNDQLLLQHSYPGGSEFVVFNRTRPETSFNVNKLFKVDPTEVALKNKKVDQLYLFNKDSATLQIGDTGQGTLAPAFLKHVLEFKPYGNDIVAYVTDVGVPSGQVMARIWDGGKNYALYTFSAGQKYLLDTAQFQNHWYYVAGSNTTERINIFKDPEDNIRNPQIGKAVPLIALSALGADKLSFSDNARFIAAESGQNFAVYDLETDTNYHYAVKSPLNGNLQWMDGHRWIGQSDGQVFVADYDNKNQQFVGSTVYDHGGLFSRDYNQMLTFVNNAAAGNVTLQRVDLRAGTDLPTDHKQ
jgi:hypothetical protein